MENIAPLSGQDGLDVLDRYLDSDQAPYDGMDLSELDGFLTGVAIGPETIPPDEWLTAIWGGEEPEFASEDEMRTVFAAILGRYNDIVTSLDADEGSFAPIYWETDDGSVNAESWAAGFLQSLLLRPDAWLPLIEDPEAQVALVPFMLFGRDEAFEEAFGDDFDEETFLAEVPDVIPACVAGIRDFWRNRRSAAPATGKSTGRRKPRRTRH